MTLLFVDGFGGGDASKYGTAPAYTPQTASPRVTSGYYWSTSGANSFKTKVFTAASEVFVGIGAKTTSTSTLSWSLSFYGDSGVTQHITVQVSTGNVIEVRRGTTGGTLLATGTTVLGTSWHYIECRVTIADSGGIVQVRLDGSTSNEINFSGDTKNAGTNTTIDAIGFGHAGSGTTTIADFHVKNTAGSVNNTWLGDVCVRTIVPTGDGNQSGLTGSDGNSVSNWQQVDELPVSSTDYNGGTTAALSDTYGFGDLPAGVTTVYGVAVNAFWAKSDAGAASANVRTRVASTNYDGATQALTTSYVGYQEIREANPNTSAAWSASDVNGAEFGMLTA